MLIAAALNTFLMALPMVFIEATATSAISVSNNPYSTRSWPTSSCQSRFNRFPPSCPRTRDPDGERLAAALVNTLLMALPTVYIEAPAMSPIKTINKTHSTTPCPSSSHKSRLAITFIRYVPAT
jgi:hypothetical protein